MKLFSAFTQAVAIKDFKQQRKLVCYLNQRKKRSLPFQLYLTEESTKEQLVFRLDHTGFATSNLLRVRRDEETRKIVLDATDGSSWHHLKGQVVQWAKALLLEPTPARLAWKLEMA